MNLITVTHLLQACAVCFGPPGHRTTQATVWAVLFMLALLVIVLGGFLAFIFHLVRRAKFADVPGLDDAEALLHAAEAVKNNPDAVLDRTPVRTHNQDMSP